MSAPVAFIAGWPVGHSRSPLVHRFWLQRHGLAGDYIRIPVPPQDFAAFLDGLPDSGRVGGNITLPHKAEAARACTTLTEAARRLDAANTLWLQDGRIHGDNTDGVGFAANLDERAPGWRNGEAALVLGAGGASRAIVDAIREAGIGRVTVLNRSPGRAEELAAWFGAGVTAGGLDRLDAELARADLIVNTTAAGMDGAEPLPLDWEGARRDAIATDAVYVPLETPFLAGARARGLAIVDGLGMLLHQAVPGFERWFGRRPVVDDELRRLVAADLAA